MDSLHFITRPDRSAPADARLDGLGHLHALVLDHFRAGIQALDIPSESGLCRASVRLHYAIETAVMTYGMMHPITQTIRDFRRVVDSQVNGDENRWFAIDEALTACLTTLRTTHGTARGPLAS